MSRQRPEAVFQQQVLDLAAAYGWTAYHTFDSRRSEPGFPDLVLVRAPELVFAELKTRTGKTTPAQVAWLEALAHVGDAVAGAVKRAEDGGHGPSVHGEPAVDVFVWRPADFDEIHDRLKPRQPQQAAA